MTPRIGDLALFDRAGVQTTEVVATGRDGATVLLNGGARRPYGCPRGAALGQSTLMIDPQRFVGEVQRFLASEPEQEALRP